MDALRASTWKSWLLHEKLCVQNQLNLVNTWTEVRLPENNKHKRMKRPSGWATDLSEDEAGIKRVADQTLFDGFDRRRAAAEMSCRHKHTFSASASSPPRTPLSPYRHSSPAAWRPPPATR